MSIYKGYFVSIEGLDGSGKTSALRGIVENFSHLGVDPLVVKEPGDKIDGKYIGSEIGGKIREILFRDPTTKVLDNDARDLLFLADHIQLWRKTIVPALSRGRVVVCDRYADSQFAYGPSKGATEWVQGLYMQQYGPKPDTTILLLGDPAFLASRTKRTGTVDEGKQEGKIWAGVEAQNIVKQAYEVQLKPHQHVITIDITPDKSIDNVREEIWGRLLPRYQRKMSLANAGQEELTF